MKANSNFRFGFRSALRKFWNETRICYKSEIFAPRSENFITNWNFVPNFGLNRTENRNSFWNQYTNLLQCSAWKQTQAVMGRNEIFAFGSENSEKCLGGSLGGIDLQLSGIITLRYQPIETSPFGTHISYWARSCKNSMTKKFHVMEKNSMT